MEKFSAKHERLMPVAPMPRHKRFLRPERERLARNGQPCDDADTSVPLGTPQ